MRWFCLAIALFLAAEPADAFSARIEAEQQKLREMAADGDFAEMNSLLAVAHSDLRNGQLAPDDLRHIVKVFETTDPRMHQTLEAWNKAMPDSVYANSAIAKMLSKSGWSMRGEDFVRRTWPEALQRAKALHARAMDHAWRAFDAAPDYMPASDSVLSLSLNASPPQSLYQILDRAMTANPNRETLMRAMVGALPNWGGDPNFAIEICEAYASKVSDIGDYSVETCLIDGAFFADMRGPIRNWAEGKLLDTTSPALESARHKAELAICARNPTECGSVYQTVLEPDSTDYEAAVAAYYHSKIFPESARKVSADDVRVVFERAYERAKTDFTYDPWNAELIEMLRSSSIFLVNEPEISVHPALDRAKTAGALRGALENVSPFDPQLWIFYASAIWMNGQASTPQADLFLQNAVVYSMHSPVKLRLWFISKMKQRELLAGATMAVPLAGQLETQEDVQIKPCLTERIARLLIASCEDHPKSVVCTEKPAVSLPDPLLVLESAAEKGLCSHELSRPASELRFSPVSVQWLN